MEFLKVLATWENVVYRFPRKNFSPTFASNCSVQLHGFSDASQNGLGFAIYARFANEYSIESSLIFARSLVVPTALRPKPTKKGLVREISIPRLELQATSLLAKAISQLKEFLQTPVECIQLWTDSSTVVQWLKLKETKEVFVRNRLPIIRNYCVNHVSTDENPADLASRGVEPHKLRGLQLWWNGPSWLTQPDETWPKAEFTYQPGDENVPSCEAVDETDCFVAVKDLGPNKYSINNWLLNVANYSDLNQALRILIYVLRLLQIQVLSKISTNNKFMQLIKDNISKSGPIRSDELKVAELALISNAQSTLSPNENIKLSLGIYEDEFGILRCRGRLHKCKSLLDESKYPIYLPHHAPITGLILRRIHWMMHHCGPGILVAEFRKNYWTPALRKLVRNYLYVNKTTKCLPCAMMRAQPFRPPPEPPLPTERVNMSRPFQHCGIDFLGP